MKSTEEKLKAIKEKQIKLAQEARQIKAKEAENKRKIETRKKIILGGLIMHKIESGKLLENELMKELNEYLTRDIDRKLFGLD